MKKLLVFLFLLGLLFAPNWEVKINSDVVYSGGGFKKDYWVAASEDAVFLVYKPTGAFSNLATLKVTGSPVVFYDWVVVPSGTKLVFFTGTGGKTEYDISEFFKEGTQSNFNITYVFNDGNRFLLFLDNGNVAVADYDNTKKNFTFSKSFKETGNVRYVFKDGRGFTSYLVDDGVVMMDSAYKQTYAKTGFLLASPVVSTQNEVYVGNSVGNIYRIAYDGTYLADRNLGSGINAIVESGVSMIVSTSSGTFLVSKDLSTAQKIDEGQSGTAKYVFPGPKSGKLVVATDRAAFITTDGLAVRKPLGKVKAAYFDNSTLFVSEGSTLKALSFEQGCAINEPSNNGLVGYKPLEIKGRAYSSKVSPQVSLRINNGEWIGLGSGADWGYQLDPNDYQFGPVVIECRVSPENDTSVLDTITLERSSALPMNKFVINYPQKLKEGDRVTFSVLNDENQNVKDFEVEFEGAKYERSDTFTVTLKNAGDRTITFRKSGYEDAVIILKIEGGIPWMLIGGIVVFLAVVYFILKKLGIL